MRVITAPEYYIPRDGDITCFLAGGITDCYDWQSYTIDYISSQIFDDTSHLVLFNPRRENFPINDPSASAEQIAWEFRRLEECDIFAMYFCTSISDQPICMYELGRNLVRMDEKFKGKNRSIIAVEYGYKRKKDVEIQTKLSKVPVTMITERYVSPENLGLNIIDTYKRILEKSE